MTPHRTPFATVEALRGTARDHLVRGNRSAARRTLIDALILDPQNTAVRRDLIELGRAPARGVPHGAGIGVLSVVAVTCAVLAMACLVGGMDVTALLLAVAGLHTGLLIARRRREVA